MKLNAHLLFSLIMLFTLMPVVVISDPDTSADTRVNDVMLTTITPATNTLWAAEDPQSDADWQRLIDAATQVIDAARNISDGGSGPNDVSWASNPEWKKFSKDLENAATKVRQAAEERNLEALMNAANDQMYPPCEDCHNQFHPGLQ